jgi:lipoprotein-anchoring transpeptidase ErfK/SrfK
VLRRTSVSALTLVAALSLVACSDGAPRPVAAPSDAALPTLDPVETETPEPEPSYEETPAASPSPSARPTRTKPLPPSYDVVAVQKRLTELRYYVGAIDGRPGRQVRSAVMAFQKVQGLPADGSVGKSTLAALKAPKQPRLAATSPAHRVEVDLTKQVMYVVDGGRITRILPVSSGSGRSYFQKNGRKARSLTPVGWYKVQRRIVGVREADLGTLYDPQYFYRGWAIHGSNSVPAYPASHGCIRVTRTDAKWLLNRISIGTHVYLYGGRHVFYAGSSAPGTDNPSGDVDGPSPSATPTPRPSSTSPKPSATPSTSSSPKPTPTPSASSGLPTPTPSKT